MPDTRKMNRHTDAVNELPARYGVKLGLYRNGTFKERLLPFDAIPRISFHVRGGCRSGIVYSSGFVSVRPELTAPVHGVVSFAGDEPMTYENTAVLKLIREE